ncbi:MAG: hypothetical protein CMJ48_03255 [Planctomycetaceae bacterium]|nr:hypothetical protein [Planctomycetaceae bacterium]
MLRLTHNQRGLLLAAIVVIATCLAFSAGILIRGDRANLEGQGGSMPTGSAPLRGPVLVEATGRDFQWHFRLAGTDQEIETADDVPAGTTLHLPPETDVELLLESEDYVYVFSNAELRLREIAVPEMTHSLRFRTPVGGTFDLLVDPICGFRFFHDPLMGRITVDRAGTVRKTE